MVKTIIKPYLGEVLENADKRVRTLKSAIDYHSLSTKLKSELISNILETSFSDVIPEVVSPKVDGQPDLWVVTNPLEIKTAKTNNRWRGGEYSKRASDYLLVSYDDTEDLMKWFILHSFLHESDWISSVSQNYYATSITLDAIIANKEFEILVGDMRKKRTNWSLICI